MRTDAQLMAAGALTRGIVLAGGAGIGVAGCETATGINPLVPATIPGRRAYSRLVGVQIDPAARTGLPALPGELFENPFDFVGRII